jgi:ankyrin repeat protein
VINVLDRHPEIVSERGELRGHDGKRTPLHFAVNSMNVQVIAALLERGADPNIRDDGDRAMPLHFVAERGHLGVVRMLIEHGADPIGMDDYHELEVIGWATVFGKSEEVTDYLLSHGARHNIFSAVATGATDAIREIAKSRTEIDRSMDRTNHHRRPLHLAVVKKQPGALSVLLELGADVEMEDAAGLTPLDQAALSGEGEMAEQLIAHGARLGLPAAVALERHDDVERLLREDPDCLRPGGRWDKLLIRASERSGARVVDVLIRAGASVDVSDDPRTSVDGAQGYTALHAAAFNGNADAARALLRHGASAVRREDKYWGTPAGWAAYAGHEAVRDIILDAPTIDMFDAVQFDRLSRIAEVLERDSQALDRRLGAYLTGNPKEPKPWIDPAWSPAAFAVAHGKVDALRVLIEKGADLTVRDSAGHTLIEMAMARGVEEVGALLQNSAAPSDAGES